MADIDLKTLTPDTSLPTTGFLFGADSQASASPSVYSTQTVATTLLGSTSLTGATITTSQPVLDLAQTWNAGAVTFTGLRFNADTGSSANSAAGSLLMDLQLEGSSRFKVGKNSTTVANSIAYMEVLVGSSVKFATYWDASTKQAAVSSDMAFGWTSGTSMSGAADLLLTRRGTANLRLGAADAAAPVAQTLSVQSVVAGTSNTAGANLTITGSQGTGTGAGGSIVFQVAPAGSSGTAQNALATALTINSDRTVSFGGSSAAVVRGSNGYLEFANTTNSSFLFFGNGYGAGNDAFTMDPNSGRIQVRANGGFAWSNQSTYANATPDVILARDNTGILALRNGGTNASPVSQQFNVYKFWVDASNYSRLEVGNSADSNTHYLYATQAGTGAARDLLVGTSGAKSLLIYTNNTPRWFVDSNGHLLAGAVGTGDNTYDIGASGANRPRNVYVAGSAYIGNSVFWGTNVLDGNGAQLGSGKILYWSSGSVIQSPADGVLRLTNYAQSDFNRLQFGGTTSSFPAIKRSSTALETKLADDSAYAPHAMQYLDVTDGITAPASATGRARIYVDTADGDLKVIFADGTVKTIVTDT